MSKTLYLYSVIVSAALISLMLAGVTNAYAQNEKYRAKLDGNNEVPAVDTPAEGVITFKTKGDVLTLKLNVTGITNATALKIYQGMKTENGQPIADLMKTSKHSDSTTGMKMRGNITDSDLVGALDGKTIDDLKTELGGGNAYINLHTAEHPDGMIRGQTQIKGTDDSSNAAMNMTGTSDSTDSQ